MGSKWIAFLRLPLPVVAFVSVDESIRCFVKRVCRRLTRAISRCTFTAKHGDQIGWKPQYAPEHILEAADEEVKLILGNLKEKL